MCTLNGLMGGWCDKHCNNMAENELIFFVKLQAEIRKKMLQVLLEY